MGDLREFAKQIRMRGEAVEKNSQRLVRTVALAVDTKVVLATPVDTGRARANWRAGTERPTDILPEPSSKEAGAQEALDQARQAVAAYRGEGEIHISNNLPYIGALNDGHSSQAPAGFVETATAAGVAVVRSAKSLAGDLEVEADTGAHAGAGTVARMNARREATRRLSMLDEEENDGA